MKNLLLILFILPTLSTKAQEIQQFLVLSDSFNQMDFTEKTLLEGDSIHVKENEAYFLKYKDSTFIE